MAPKLNLRRGVEDWGIMKIGGTMLEIGHSWIWQLDHIYTMDIQRRAFHVKTSYLSVLSSQGPETDTASHSKLTTTMLHSEKNVPKHHSTWTWQWPFRVSLMATNHWYGISPWKIVIIEFISFESHMNWGNREESRSRRRDMAWMKLCGHWCCQWGTVRKDKTWTIREPLHIQCQW